jgi:hypothetical protein
MSSAGRGGRIVYEEPGRILELWWEMSSGFTKDDVLLAPLNLSRWTEPAGERVPVSKQLEILARLRDWLANQNIKSDIEQPPSTDGDQRCVWAGCPNPRLDGVVHCASHFDLMLLGTVEGESRV